VVKILKELETILENYKEKNNNLLFIKESLENELKKYIKNFNRQTIALEKQAGNIEFLKMKILSS
jgi:hypothetical protein